MCMNSNYVYIHIRNFVLVFQNQPWRKWVHHHRFCFEQKKKSSLLYFIAIFSILSLFFLDDFASSSSCLVNADAAVTAADSQFEGFDADELDQSIADGDDDDDQSLHLTHTLRSTPLSTHLPPDPLVTTESPPKASAPADAGVDVIAPPKPLSNGFDYWDEDEFEGLPVEQPHSTEIPAAVEENVKPDGSDSNLDSGNDQPKHGSFSLDPRTYVIEIVCVSFLIVFAINYFTGKKENENLALAWAAKFATNGAILEKNFSHLGVGESDDSPLLLKEGQTVFKFYASGRRYCQGLLATMELKSRHDLISRIYNMIVPCKDEITIEVYMNDEAMDHVVFALAKKKAAKGMQKELGDLQRYASLMSPPTNRKWVVEELSVITESKEVAGDLISEAVLDQVFGEKAYQKFGKYFISMHFSDQEPGSHRKMLLFKFSLPDIKNIGDITRLVALVPYYIDLIGHYKLSSQARTKTEAARSKAAQEAYKELQNARQEALQKKKAERKKLIEEAEAKLGAEALRKKEAKDRARSMKKSMPKMKMTRAH